MSDASSERQTGGEGTFWLYKQHELLLGPVAYEDLVEEIEAGNVGPTAVVCQQGSGSEFRPIGEEPLFMVALAKAEARQKVEAQHRDAVSTRRKAAGLNAAVIVLAAAVGVLLMGLGARWLAVNRPWERKVVLPDPIITDEMPVIALAAGRGASGDDDEGMAYPVGGKPSQESGKSAQAQQPQGTAVASAARPHDAKKPASPPARSAARQSKAGRDGLSSQQEWDEDAIQRIVASKKKTLHPCLTAEAHRQSESNPTWSARIPLEFTIANSGRVSKLWIDHHEYKDSGSELYKCMFKTLSTWKFPAYSGEQANISLAFNVQAR